MMYLKKVIWSYDALILNTLCGIDNWRGNVSGDYFIMQDWIFSVSSLSFITLAQHKRKTKIGPGILQIASDILNTEWNRACIVDAW